MRERDLQVATMRTLRKVLGPHAIALHVPNERQGAAARMRLAKEGVVPGAPDVLILDNGRAFALELKAPKGRQSPAQKIFETRCEATGIPYRLCRSLDDVLDAVTAWGLLRPGVEIERRRA